MVGALIGTALLTGCAAKQEANDTLPTASPSPTEELPPLGPPDFPVPAEARTKDAAGAEAFLEYYLELSDRQQVKLDGEPLRALGPECYECHRIAKAFEDVAAASHRYEGGELSLNDALEPRIDANEASLTFTVRQEAVRLVDQAGNTVDEGLPTQPSLSSGMTLVWSQSDHGWLVKSMTLG